MAMCLETVNTQCWLMVRKCDLSHQGEDLDRANQCHPIFLLFVLEGFTTLLKKDEAVKVCRGQQPAHTFFLLTIVPFLQSR